MLLLPPPAFFSSRRALPVWLQLSLVLALPALSLAATPGETADAELVAQQTEAQKAFREGVVPFVKDYCLDCHGNRRTKGGLNLEPALKKPGESSASRKWLQAFANVNAHDMPPEDSDQPSDAERQRFLDALVRIKYLSARDPGPFVIRRLTKMEFGNTLRDLFGVDPAVAKELPDEVPGQGYLNSLSPMQTEQYLGIAEAVLEQVLGTAGGAAPQPPKGGTTERQAGAVADGPPKGGTTIRQPGAQVPEWRRIWEKQPQADARERARQVAKLLARQAYRRPPTDAEVDVLVSVFDLGRDNRLDERGALRLMLKALLVSPQFLFITPAREAPAGEKIVPLDDHQLAARLSYLLWATLPDAELSALADAGTLHQPEVLRVQVRRLLADPRSRALFDGFGAQWLGLGNLGSKTFDAKKFPQMTPELRQAMYDEARLFFDSLVRENRSVVALVDSDYTFVNGPLAKIYGLEKQVTGLEMRQVKLTDKNRGGILGMPGILATTSFPNRTSAVNRGVWVLEQVLGEHVPPAPPNVPALDKQDAKTVANLTLRQRTELHRTNAVCANCHKILDPIGFGLENFDAIGRWRDTDDTGGAIDAAGELPGGQRFASPRELKAILAARKDDLARNLTEKLLAYALCRQLEGYDQIVVDRLMKTIAQDGYRMQTLLTEIVTSYPFLNRRVQD